MSEYAKLNGNIAAKKSVAGNVGIKDFYIGPKGDPGPRGEKGEKGDPGAIDFRIVPELPTDDYSESTIYLVPLSPGSENNEYAEYVFINGKPEYVGSATVEVDLSDYVKKDDFANADNAGVVLMTRYGQYGLYMASDGTTIAILKASNKEIDEKNNSFKPIVPSTLDYAVKKALSDCKLSGKFAWTDEEKAKALKLLGGVAKVSNPNLIYGSTTNYPVTFSPIAYGVPRYSANATLTTSTPIADNDSANKKYVDDLVGSVQSILTELHAYAQTKIGGEA